MKKEAKTLFVLVAMLLAVNGYCAKLHDPTVPLGVSKQLVKTNKKERQDAALILTSIIISADTRIAIINDRRYRESDRLGDLQLISIEKKTVILANKRKRLKLRVSSREIMERDR